MILTRIASRTPSCYPRTLLNSQELGEKPPRIKSSERLPLANLFHFPHKYRIADNPVPRHRTCYPASDPVTEPPTTGGHAELDSCDSGVPSFILVGYVPEHSNTYHLSMCHSDHHQQAIASTITAAALACAHASQGLTKGHASLIILSQPYLLISEPGHSTPGSQVCISTNFPFPGPVLNG